MTVNNFHTLIVGAGFSGAVLAERIASQLDEQVLIIEKRAHIGGNAFDYLNDEGILVHKYGPHIFHTNHVGVWEYLSHFTQWNGYTHKVLSCVDGKMLPIPINRNTVNILLGKNFTDEQQIEQYFDSVRVHMDEARNSRDVVVSQVGELFYEKFFRNYTKKQWGVYPEELSAEVTKRIPVRFNTDDRYFSDKYQGLPSGGYSAIFEKLLAHKNISVLLNTDYKDILSTIQYERLIYTGPIDYFFDYKYGRLPYRSLRFEEETLEREYYQEVAVINYPNDFDFTRTTEFKHMTMQKHPKTTICREYPMSEGEPYYPMPMPEASKMYDRYRTEAEKLRNVYFVGRLAEYRYFNMDQVIQRSLDTFQLLACRGRTGKNCE